MKARSNLAIALLSALTLLCSSAALAAGSGGGGGGATTSHAGVAPRTPEELAARNYKSGLKQKDKALKALDRAGEAKNDKAKLKQEKKANKAFAKAASHFKKVLQHEPRHYKAANELGYSLRNTGDYQNAVGAYNYALQLKPDFLEAIEYRGEAFVALGLFEQARKSYLRLYREDQTLAAQLMSAMSAWAENRSAGEAVLTEGEQKFADWIAERQRLVGFSANPDAEPSAQRW
ncbi:MAG: hypothetical protein ACR2PZ_12145 [Pseudomonadales bacterium]